MENILKKSGVYGLLFGLAVAILLVDYKDVSNVNDGVSITTYEPVFGYIVSILRFGVVGMFAGLLTGWKVYEKKNEPKKRKAYYVEFFVAVFLIATISIIVFDW